MELCKGRPADTAGREARELRVYDFLDELGIEYYRTDHPDAPADTMENCRRVDAVLGVRICKNLFLTNRQQTEFYLLMMPGDKPFRTKELSAQIHSARLSFASPRQMEEMLDVTPGSVSIMGLMNDREGRVHFLVDEELLGEEWLGCHPCRNTSSLRLRTADALGPFLRATGHGMQTVTLRGE